MHSRTSLELQLLGTPQLRVNGQAVTVSPPAAFELLCLIIVSGESGISGKAASKQLWSHLAAKNAMTQLRFNLMKLRDHDSFEIFFDLGTDQLKVLPQVKVSVDINRVTAPSAAELPKFIRTIANSWNKEHWQYEADKYAAKLASWIEILGDEVGIASVQAAHLCFPDSFPLATIFVRRLQSALRLTEAHEVILRFENAWIDRFGTADLPNISLSPIPAPVETPRTADLPNISLGPIPAPVETPRTADRKRIILAIAAIALLGIIAAGIAIYLLLSRRTEPGPPKPRLQLSLVQSYTKTVDGVRFKVRKFKVDHPWAYMLGFHALNQTDLRVESSEALPVLLTLSDEIRPTPSDEIRNDHGITIGPWDEFRGFSVRGAINRQFKPLPGYPYLDPHILNDGSLLLSRHCEHPYIDHYRLTHFYDGAERLIAPTGPLPQITAFNVFTSTTVYGKYSYGRQEGWRYHAFRYDIQSHKFEDLSIPPVVGILDDHTLVCQPEVTTVINDDYDTHPSGEVVVIDQTTGKQIRQRWVADGNPGLGIFPPFALKIQRANTRSSKVIFLDKSLNRVNPFPELNGNFGRIESYSNQNLLLVPFDRAEQSREFWLITRLDPL